MKKFVSFLFLFVVVTHSVQAQSFGQAFLNTLSKGMKNMTEQQRQQLQQRSQQQNSNSASDLYQRSKDALNSSSFSLANTHAPSMTNGTVRYSNGSVFTGTLMDGQPINGILEKADGTRYHCSIVNGAVTGSCFTEWTDGSWYYGNWKNGAMHGEGSYYDGEGNYYDMIYDDGNVVSKTYVATPKHSKEEWLAVEQQKAQIIIDAMNELGNSYNQGSSSGSSSSRYSNSNSNSRYSNSSSRSCGVCHGTGKCNTCSGRGYYTSIGIGTGTHLCSICNHTGRCHSCNGTGRR